MEQTATPKKRIVFDDSVYDEDLLRELLEDRYVSNGDMQELNDDFVNENWYQLDEYRQQDYEDEIAALTAYFDGESSTMSSVVAEHGGNPLIVTGSVGRWDGIHTGFTVFKDFGDLMEGPDTPFKDCEIQKVWDENGHLFIHGAHHDGSVTIEVKQLSDVGAEAYEAISEAWVDEPFTANGKTYDGSERSVIDALGDLWHATEPPLYMERAFGCPAEEWEQPETPLRFPDLTTGNWRVHLVMPGDHYGRGDVLTYEQEKADRYGSGLPMVEFYDTSQDPTRFPGGQFVSRYYMDTLLGTDSLKLGVPLRDMQAFSLDGGVPAWTVSGDDLKRVAEWLDAASLSGVHKGFDPTLPTTEYGQFPFDGLSAEQYLDVAAGDSSSDFDLDGASVDLVDAVNEILRPHGVITTVSGIAYCNSGVGPDLAPHELSQLVHDSVDVYQILQNHDVSEHAEPSVSLKGEAAASREAADVLASKTGHGEHLLDTR